MGGLITKLDLQDSNGEDHFVEVYISDLLDIIDELNEKQGRVIINRIKKNNNYQNITPTMIDDMKEEWWESTKDKISLERLEEAFGDKWSVK